MALVNKKWRKDASDNALNAGMRVLGAIGTSILLQKAPDFFKSENVKNTVNNILPPLVNNSNKQARSYAIKKEHQI